MRTRSITTTVFLLSVMLGGCVTPIRIPIREPTTPTPSIKEVRMNVAQHIDQRVRWGGVIQKVENHKEETLVELVGHRLDKTGRPVPTDQNPGRFIAQIKGFLDPAIYASERMLTIAGTVTTGTTRQIGEYTYHYPQIKVDKHHLWPKRDTLRHRYYPDPFWYDPFWYNPWYPWHPLHHPRW